MKENKKKIEENEEVEGKITIKVYRKMHSQNKIKELTRRTKGKLNRSNCCK